MKQIAKKKMIIAMWILLPSMALTPLKAQEKLVLNLDQALEIALSENPTVQLPTRK